MPIFSNLSGIVSLLMQEVRLKSINPRIGMVLWKLMGGLVFLDLRPYYFFNVLTGN